MSRISAIVLSAGKGSRMNSDIAKQYIEINGRPILYYSLKAFEDSIIDDIIIVVGEGDADFVKKEIADRYGLKKVSKIVTGGKERFNSVFNGLNAVGSADYVLIHDGARPMLTPEIITNIIEEVKVNDACVAGMPSKDTIKIADEAGYISSTPDRNLVWNIHTPQAFSYPLIMKAYSKLMETVSDIRVTDDAMVVESMTGHKIKLVKGSYENIKVTTPEDLLLAEEIIKSQNELK